MKRTVLVLGLSFSLISVNLFAAPFALESSAFKLNSLIPDEFTCHGKNSSPPLAWEHIPPNTQSLALVVTDPDAPAGTWTHWVVFNIPASVHQLDAAGPLPKGAVQAQNSWGSSDYRGPCPPMGMHRYVFTLYALDKPLSLNEGVAKEVALDAMTGHVIGTAQWIGLYQK